MKRSKVDWVLEAVALAAVVSAIAIVAIYWTRIPDRVVELGYRYGRAPGIAGIMTAKNALWMVTLIDALAYVGLTVGSSGEWLFQIPTEMDRMAPQLRQMLFSMVIVMKAVLTLFVVYLVWALVNVGLRRGGGLSGGFLTLFTLAVPLPLLLYTLKLRKYRR